MISPKTVISNKMRIVLQFNTEQKKLHIRREYAVRKRKNNKLKPTIAEIQNNIRAKMSNNSMYSINTGLNREDLVMLALIEMKKSHEIFDYLPSGRITKVDIRGYDFTVISVGKSRYEEKKISVTGPRWVSYHKEKHPDIPVLCVKDGDDTETIKERIRKIIHSPKK